MQEKEHKSFEEWYLKYMGYPLIGLKPSSFCNRTYEANDTEYMYVGWKARSMYRVMKWKLIDTAPKDGSAYLGVIKVGSLFAEPFIANYDLDEGGHCCKYQTEPLVHRPTHWMPLPGNSTTDSMVQDSRLTNEND